MYRAGTFQGSRYQSLIERSGSLGSGEAAEKKLLLEGVSTIGKQAAIRPGGKFKKSKAGQNRAR